jgi:hypothetical protein
LHIGVHQDIGQEQREYFISTIRGFIKGKQ